MNLEAILEQGRSYLAHMDTIYDETRDADWRIEIGLRALRQHSTNMRELSRCDCEALLAAIVGGIKWHERHDPCGGHLGECLRHLEDAAASLRLANLEDEQA
jgi:hypothetical protein